MASIRRLRVLWGGIAGMPGYSLFYGSAAADPTGDVLTFFNAIKAIFPASLSWTIPPGGDVLDDATGTLTGGWAGAGGGIVSSTGSGTYAAGTGMWVNWSTGAIVRGRRLRGKTFVCPVLSSVYDNNGTITTPNITLVGGAATTLAATGKLVCWSRPTAPGASDGSSSIFTAGTVPDQVTSLRSRRT